MSSQQPPAGDFSFPSLSGTQPSTGTQSNPFAVQPTPPAARPAPSQVQLQKPVQPQSTEPLTARSTVVHASSRTAAPQAPQQQQQGGSLSQQPAAAAQKPVPISQVSQEPAKQRWWPNVGTNLYSAEHNHHSDLCSLVWSCHFSWSKASWSHPAVKRFLCLKGIAAVVCGCRGVQCAMSACGFSVFAIRAGAG